MGPEIRTRVEKPIGKNLGSKQAAAREGQAFSDVRSFYCEIDGAGESPSASKAFFRRRRSDRCHPIRALHGALCRIANAFHVGWRQFEGRLMSAGKSHSLQRAPRRSGPCQRSVSDTARPFHFVLSFCLATRRCMNLDPSFL